MIRYPVKVSELKRRINQVSKTWLQRAKARTDKFRVANKYDERSSIWSEIKVVYMKLQHNKCAYCERQLEGPRFGKIEHDLEHYRPKNAVKKWSSPHINYSTGQAWSEGYYLLAYHTLNYVTACKVCNTPLKSNYFPIAGARGPQRDNPRHLRSEKPFLIYPLGRIDKDPETLITFDGILPVPKGHWGHRFRRGMVTLEFFQLHRRETLLKQRAEQIRALWFALMILESNLDQNAKEFAANTIKQLTSRATPHCNCTRSFLALYQHNYPKAKAIAVGVKEFLNSLM